MSNPFEECDCKNEYSIEPHGGKGWDVEFEDETKYTWFLLKWS